jgi:HAMP domain-containing protein
MNFYNKKSSVSRDFLILSSILILLLAIIAIWVAYRTFENYAEDIISDIESEAIRIDRSVILEINSASYLLESLARQIVQMKTPAEIARLLGSFNDNNKEINNEIIWLDSNQNVIISSNDNFVKQKINLSDRDYIKKSLTAPWQVHIGRSSTSKTNNKLILPVSLGVTNYRGEFIGTLMLGIDVHAMTKELKNIIQLSKMDFSILTNSISIIANSKETLQQAQILDTKLVKQLNNQTEMKSKGIISSPDLFSWDIEFSYFEKSSKYPYIIYVSYNYLQNDDTIFNLIKARMVQILIIFCFLLALLWMVKSRIIKPVEELSEITARINSGGRYQPISKGGPLEIELLASQIRKLSDYLIEQNRNNHELKLKNQYLNKITEQNAIADLVQIDFLLQTSHELDIQINQLNRTLINYGQNISLSDATQRIDFIKLILQDINYIAVNQYKKLHVNETTINLNFIIHRAMRKFHEFQSFKHIDVKLKIEDAIPLLLGDEAHFTNIIIYLLCGCAQNISQNSAVEIHAYVAYNEHNHKELNIQLKYSSPQHQYQQSQIATESNKDAQDKPQNEPAIKTSVINLMLAKMIISIFGGNMSINTSKDNVNRIFVRFPQNIIIQS